MEEGVRFEERADGARFCLRCREVTHDLREATRREAAALYRANGNKLCAMVRVGSSGEVQFRPEPPPRGLATVGGAALALAVAACEPEPRSQSITASPETASVPAPSATPPTPEPAPQPAAPPPSVAAAAPETPPAPARDTTDHSTDASPRVEDHRRHRHRHEPVQHEDGMLVGALDGL